MGLTPPDKYLMARIAMLSVHTCPLAALGGKETGGMNVYVRELSRELGRRGFCVDVFTRCQNGAVPQVVPLGEGARVIHLDTGPCTPLPREQVFHYLPAFVKGVEAFSRSEGITYDVIHSHYWLSGWVALRLRERWGIPVIQMFHTLASLKNRALGGEREPELRVRVEATLLEEADIIVAPTPVERAELVWRFGAAPGRIAVIPCGVDLEMFRPIPREAALAEVGLGSGPLLLSVGRLTPIKGFETLLRAFSHLTEWPDLRLLIVGGGIDDSWNGEPARLHRLAGELGVAGRVEFVGALPQERLPFYYSAAETVIMPSYYESFGMVALEAMACGSPVIASRVGGLAVTVQDEVTGFLIPEGNPDALATRIRALLADPPLRQRLGAAAQHWAAGFRWPRIGRAIVSLYGRVAPGALEKRWHCRSSIQDGSARGRAEGRMNALRERETHACH